MLEKDSKYKTKSQLCLKSNPGQKTTDKRQDDLTQDTGRHRLKIHDEMRNRWTQSGVEQTITLTRKHRGRKYSF